MTLNTVKALQRVALAAAEGDSLRAHGSFVVARLMASSAAVF
jgi:hypothetical protein